MIKIVRVFSYDGDIIRKSFIGDSPYSVVYGRDVVTRPDFGELYLFDTESNAIEFLHSMYGPPSMYLTSRDYELWTVVSGPITRRRVMCHYIHDIRWWWQNRGRATRDYNTRSPKGTCSTTWIRLATLVHKIRFDEAGGFCDDQPMAYNKDWTRAERRWYRERALVRN